MKVLIVGGGIGGMALAIKLSGRGVSTLIAEVDPDWRAVGAGLTLNGMTLKAFLELGVLDRIREHAHVHGGRRTYGAGWEVLMDQPAFVPADGDLTSGGGILRPVLHQILRDAAVAAGTEAMLGTSVATIVQGDDHVDVGFTDGTSDRFDLVVGADGLRSKVRDLCFPDAPQPVFSGEGCWRAVFPRPADIAAPWTVLGHQYKAGLRPVSQDEMYLHLLEYVPDNPWLEENQWPFMLAERLATFGGLLAELGATLHAGSPVNYRPIETNLLPLPWHEGRVVLIGDAAHATSPHAAYGAGLAVEDALVLNQALQFDRPIEQRLQMYGAARFDRCRDVVERAVHLGRVEMDDGSPDEWHAAMGALREAILKPLPPLPDQ
jgi:2-polyprenyl-6-methoxyphenol hydroxylase-like FAD-dependent oxidoreductase